jgi:trehalose/maltose transport system substrate-binding protein
MCNALEWLASDYAGQIVEPDGSISIDNPAAVDALSRPIHWLTAVSPESVLSFTEVESLALFASGNAAFLRHWPGAWGRLTAAGSDLAGKVGIAPLPKGSDGGRHAATLGGWQLAVSRHSPHPDLAADLVAHLTSAKVQRRRALAAALLPTRPAVYRDVQLQAAVPVSRLLAEGRVELVARPSTVTGDVYPQVSATVQKWVFELLVGRAQAEEVVLQLAQELERLRQPGGKWQGGR